MSHSAQRFAGWLLWLASALAGLPAATDGQDFRVDTEVFVGQEKTPALETLTIFSEGRVFDFVLAQPREVAILDPSRGQFTLLEESRRVKAVITTADLFQYTADLEAEAAKVKDAVLAFAAQPKFEISAQETNETGEPLVRLTLAARPLEYVVLGKQPENADAAKRYRHFADWYARLNATRPDGLPPAARLVLNAELADRGLLPLEVTRTITPSSLAKKQVVRTRHLVNWTLSGEDRKKLALAGDWMAQFTPVSFDDYRRQSPVGPPAKQSRR
jgi:hypothetical protein